MVLAEQGMAAMAYREMAFSVTAFYQFISEIDSMIVKQRFWRKNDRKVAGT